MTHDERMALYEQVSVGLRKQPGESIEQRARYWAKHARGRRLHASRVILNGGPDPWAVLAEAAKILRGLKRLHVIQGGR